MPKQPDNKNQSTRHHNRRSPEPGQNHALTLNGRIMVLLLVIGFIAAGCGVLIYKLYTLQIRDAEQYRVQAAEQQLSDPQIPATRGSIYSANGKLLAKSSVVWNIIANPSKCNQDYVAEASQKISELLNGSVSAEKIQEQLSKTNSQYRVIAKDIDMVTAQSIIDYANTKRITNGKAEGDPDAKYETVLSMYKESSSTREYPNGMYLSSVLGFCDDSGNGMYGLEKSYDEKLVGTPGRSISSENAWGYELANEESDTHAAINGYNLNLTIDDTIQTVLETELSNAIDDYDVQNRASAIVMNVNTGAVLGMATAPQFDPNDPYNITEPKLQAILDNAGTALTEDDISVLQSRLGQDAVADIIADGVVNPNGTKSIDEEGNKILERRNGSGAKVKGINLEGKIIPHRDVQIQLGISLQQNKYNRPQSWSDDPDTKKTREMVRSPNRYGYFTFFTSPFKKFGISASGTYTGSMYVPHMAGYIEKDKLEKSGDFFDANIKLNYDFTISGNYILQLNCGIQNIFQSYQKDFDRGEFRDAGYIYGPGLPRSWFAGIKLSLN